MPISVNAVGKPSMIATTISASISRPRWPLVICDGAGISTNTAITTIAMIDRPNQTSFLIAALPLAVDDERVELLDVLVLDVDHLLQLVDVDFLDVLLARRPLALRRQMTQRMISTMPCSSSNAPAIGITVLNG